MKKLHIEVVDRETAAILVRKSYAERAAMVASAHRTAKKLLAAGARLRHPEWNEEQVAAEVARLLLHGAV